MARLRDALILDEISFLDERLGSNPILTMRNIFYFLGGGLIAYKFYSSDKVGLQIAGILIFIFVLTLILYPKKSTTLESTLNGMISYLLGFDNENVIREEKKRAQKKKDEENLRKDSVEEEKEVEKSPSKPSSRNALGIERIVKILVGRWRRRIKQ
jgi:hypothetical protein